MVFHSLQLFCSAKVVRTVARSCYGKAVKFVCCCCFSSGFAHVLMGFSNRQCVDITARMTCVPFLFPNCPILLWWVYVYSRTCSGNILAASLESKLDVDGACVVSGYCTAGLMSVRLSPLPAPVVKALAAVQSLRAGQLANSACDTCKVKVRPLRVAINQMAIHQIKPIQIKPNQIKRQSIKSIILSSVALPHSSFLVLY